MKTAILIDGAFFIKRIRHFEPHNAYDPVRMATLAHRLSLLHLAQNIGGKRRHDELHRILFYDCAPLEKKMHHPLSKKAIDFKQSEEALFRQSLHRELVKKRKLALRLGKLSASANWTIKPHVIEALLKGKKRWSDLDDHDLIIDVKQKGVDMRIALDIAALALKQQVGRIVLLAGDADFVPAAKLARREGIDFVLDPMWKDIPQDLFEHIDGLKSTYPKNTFSSITGASKEA